MKLIRIFAIAILTCAAAACSHVTHLTSADKSISADIYVDGGAATATWSWGPTTYNKKFTVIDNSMINAGLVQGGTLKLKMEDGTILSFISENNAVVCDKECNDVHLPITWWLVKN